MSIIASIFNLAILIGEVNYILYATRVLGLDGALVGAVFAIGGVASVLGATQVSTSSTCCASLHSPK